MDGQIPNMLRSSATHIDDMRGTWSHVWSVPRIRTRLLQLARASEDTIPVVTRRRTRFHLPMPPLKSTVLLGRVFFSILPSSMFRAFASSCSCTFASSTGGGFGGSRYRFGVHSFATGVGMALGGRSSGSAIAEARRRYCCSMSSCRVQ